MQPEDDYAVTVMSGKTEEDASEEKQAENDTNQIQDVSKQEKSRKSSWKEMLR